MVESDFYAFNTGKISPYDQYIRQYSQQLGWDWRLLASLIYQESRFKDRCDFLGRSLRIDAIDAYNGQTVRHCS